jgi:hypothetical protein
MGILLYKEIKKGAKPPTKISINLLKIANLNKDIKSITIPDIRAKKICLLN